MYQRQSSYVKQSIVGYTINGCLVAEAGVSGLLKCVCELCQAARLFSMDL